VLFELIVVAVFPGGGLRGGGASPRRPADHALAGPAAVLRFEEVPDSALSAAQAAHLARLDAELDGLRYRPLFNIRVANLGNANLSRFYTSDADPPSFSPRCCACRSRERRRVTPPTWR